jgi:hypothetical protein
LVFKGWKCKTQQQGPEIRYVIPVNEIAHEWHTALLQLIRSSGCPNRDFLFCKPGSKNPLRVDHFISPLRRILVRSGLSMEVAREWTFHGAKATMLVMFGIDNSTDRQARLQGHHRTQSSVDRYARYSNAPAVQQARQSINKRRLIDPDQQQH